MVFVFQAIRLIFKLRRINNERLCFYRQKKELSNMRKMGLRYFTVLVLLGLALVDAKSLKEKQLKKSHHEEKKHDEPPPTDEVADDASGSAGGESGSAEESGAPPPTEVSPEPTTKALPYKVVGPLGGHPHPGPPSASNPCPQPRYCDPARCKDPIGCAPSCSDICCADILIPPPTPPVGSGAGPCPQTCAPNYLPGCCMGAAPPMGPAPAFPQPVYPPMGPQPGFSPPAGQIQPAFVPQAPPASCDQSCYTTNCAPPCPPTCCRRKKSSIHHHRKTRSITTGIAMCH
ncbi:hypothetical protein ABFA07_003911 [Porites harrisoni]